MARFKVTLILFTLFSFSHAQTPPTAVELAWTDTLYAEQFREFSGHPLLVRRVACTPPPGSDRPVLHVIMHLEEITPGTLQAVRLEYNELGKAILDVLKQPRTRLPITARYYRRHLPGQEPMRAKALNRLLNAWKFMGAWFVWADTRYTCHLGEK